MSTVTFMRISATLWLMSAVVLSGCSLRPHEIQRQGTNPAPATLSEAAFETAIRESPVVVAAEVINTSGEFPSDSQVRYQLLTVRITKLYKSHTLVTLLGEGVGRSDGTGKLIRVIVPAALDSSGGHPPKYEPKKTYLFILMPVTEALYARHRLEDVAPERTFDAELDQQVLQAIRLNEWLGYE